MTREQQILKIVTEASSTLFLCVCSAAVDLYFPLNETFVFIE